VSSIDTQTRYDYSLSVVKESTGAQSVGSFTLWAESGTTDSIAIAMLQAMKGVVWPPGITVDITVARTVVDQTYSALNLAATPPVFS
jgi:hypothetical protein